MRRFTLIGAALMAALLAGATAAQADILIRINKITQRMTVSVDGQQRYNWAVSTGKVGYATPSGSYRPFRLEKVYYSKEWDDAPMPNAIFFTARGHAIHGTYSTRWLGSPVSHGCVRLSPGNAATLYAMVQAEGLGNTRVVITGGPSFGLFSDAGEGPGFGHFFSDTGQAIRKGTRKAGQTIADDLDEFSDWINGRPHKNR